MNPLWRFLLFLFPTIIVFAVLLPIYFQCKQHGELNQSVIVKGLCCLTFFIFCFNGCFVNRYIAFWLILAALLFNGIGSMVLERKLVFGAALLGIGHLIISFSFYIMAKPHLSTILAALILLLFSCILLRKTLPVLKKFCIPFLLYNAAAFTMFSLALSLPYSTGTACMAGGTGLLAAAGLFAAHTKTKKAKTEKRDEILLSVLYCLALNLLSLSVWL